MPLYDYKCEACGHKFESFSVISEKDMQTCPACEATKVRTCITCKGFFSFPAGYWESLGENVESKQDLVKKCKARGLRAEGYM